MTGLHFGNRRSGPSRRNQTAMASYDIVLPDTNILVTYVKSKSDGTLVCAVFDKVRKSDTLIITNQVMEELYRIDIGKNYGHEEITAALRRLRPKMVFVINPTEADLEGYHIDDPNDRQILYSADLSKAEVILTNDKAWFRDNVSGLDAVVMDPMGYLYHEEIEAGTKRFDNPNVGRIHRIFKRGD